MRDLKLLVALVGLLRFDRTQAFTIHGSNTAVAFKRRHSQDRFENRIVPRNIDQMKQEMVRNRGLESREEGATPTPGGMTLYIKAGPDGESVGDCPFAHFVRMVLHEKNLEYELRPSTPDTKPSWLVDYYGGSMPALRHRKECYIESDVIAEYLDFFFQTPPLSDYPKKIMNAGKDSLDGFFPAVARYLKSTDNGSEEDLQLKSKLESSLAKVEEQLKGGENNEKTGPFLVGDGEHVTLLDCSLAPKLYHLSIGLKAFKDGAIDIKTQFPGVQAYMDHVFATSSFVDASYPEETVVWGWSNARS